MRNDQVGSVEKKTKRAYLEHKPPDMRFIMQFISCILNGKDMKFFFAKKAVNIHHFELQIEKFLDILKIFWFLFTMCR